MSKAERGLIISSEQGKLVNRLMIIDSEHIAREEEMQMQGVHHELGSLSYEVHRLEESEGRMFVPETMCRVKRLSILWRKCVETG